jgi:hypothetical protein
MKATTHTLLSAAQSTGLRALSLCHWVVNVAAAVQRSVRQGCHGSAAAPCRGISPTSPDPGGNRDRRRTAPRSAIASMATSCGKPLTPPGPPCCYWISTALSRRILQRGLANSRATLNWSAALPHHSGDKSFRHIGAPQPSEGIPGARCIVMRVTRAPDDLRSKIPRQFLDETSSRLPGPFSLFLPGSCPNNRNRRRTQC